MSAIFQGHWMRTRTFCPGCGGYRDIEDGHRVCTFCEYLEEQRDSANLMLAHELAPRSFHVDGIAFAITFGTEQGNIVAGVDVADPRYQLLADCLTVIWKLRPVELLESLCDYRTVTVGGEFYTITYGDDPDHGEGDPLDVNIFDGDSEINVPTVFFSAVVVEVAKIHLQAAGQVPWVATLSPAAKAKIS
jgi:hypothetical protein